MARIDRTFLLITAFLSTQLIASGSSAAQAEELVYPEARRSDQVDTYHGIRVPDPYRWLEQLDAPETQAWMKAQEELLASFLDPEAVARIEHQIEAFSATGATTTAPVHAGGRYFYTVRQPDEQHRVIYVRRGLDGPPVALVDPNGSLAEGEGTGGFSVSPSGRYLATRTVTTGSRWGRLEIRDGTTGHVLDRPLGGLMSPATAWSLDESGFYYVDFGDPSALQRGDAEPTPEVRFHRLGTDPATDPVIYPQSAGPRPAEPGGVYSLTVGGDRKTLVLSVFQGTSRQNRVLIADLTEPVEFVELPTGGEHAYTFLGSRGERLFFYTNRNAPNGRIVAVDRRASADHRWTEVVPESREVLAGGSTAGGNAMALVGDRLALLYRRANVAILRVFGLDGVQQHEIPLNAGWIGSGLVGSAEVAEVWYTFNGFVEPSTVYRLDLETGDNRPFFRRQLPFQPSDYVLEHVFYKSADQTEVPLFVAHKKGLQRDGKAPVFMYGYGFGGWVATPWNQPHILAWLEMGGVYALPGIRGGGEYGEAWRDAGVRLHRQNAIDDYITAAEWLVERRYTSPGRVVANGWSASGSLAAAAVLQRPELFGAGLIGIPSLDLLRYHHFTAVKGWTRGYGSSDDPEEFEALYRYSPYQNLRADRCYPPILVTVGEKDDLTPPLHGYKFIAALQHKKSCPQLGLLKIVRGAGHSFGTTSEQSRRTYAEEIGFLNQVLGLSDLSSGSPSP